MSSPALLQILEINKVQLLRFLRGRLGCEDTAQDVLQSISERLIAHPVSARVQNPRSYLFRVAANAANSHLRARNTRTRYESDAAAAMEVLERRDPERVLLAQDALAAADEALAELPALTRRMFLAFRVEGMAQREIAKRFGVSLSTVEKRIAKAAAHCYQRLAAKGFTGSLEERRPRDDTNRRRKSTR